MVRPAKPSDLAQLLSLFADSEVSASAEPLEHAERIWAETLSHPGAYVFVSEDQVDSVKHLGR